MTSPQMLAVVAVVVVIGFLKVLVTNLVELQDPLVGIALATSGLCFFKV